MILRVYSLALFGVVISCLIFPNSLKLISAISLAVGFLCAITRVRIDTGLILVLKLWFMTSLVTLFYIFVGLANGATTEAALQVLLIYIIFPFVWIFVIKLLLEVVPLDLAVKGLISVGVLGCLSVFFFYYSFLNNGPESVEFFIEVPNVDVGEEGNIAATMYVFGTLIFIIGGYISSFSSLTGGKKSTWLLSLFVFVALVSGRSALILAVLIGFIINAIVTGINFKRTRHSNFLRDTLWVVFSCVLVFVALNYFDLQFERIISLPIEKIAAMGGEGRNQQLFALIDGVGDTAGLGSGHGIGVDYKVSDIYPWRYEMVWVASVFRVGFIGAMVYSAPFILVIVLGFRRMLKKALDENEIFVFGGFISAFIASNTNPYIEALVFQWMFILPVLYFTRKGGHHFVLR